MFDSLKNFFKKKKKIIEVDSLLLKKALALFDDNPDLQALYFEIYDNLTRIAAVSDIHAFVWNSSRTNDVVPFGFRTQYFKKIKLLWNDYLNKSGTIRIAFDDYGFINLVDINDNDIRKTAVDIKFVHYPATGFYRDRKYNSFKIKVQSLKSILNREILKQEDAKVSKAYFRYNNENQNIDLVNSSDNSINPLSTTIEYVNKIDSAFNIVKLEMMLGFIDAEEIRFFIWDENSPIRIRPVGDDIKEYILMPMKHDFEVEDVDFDGSGVV